MARNYGDFRFALIATSPARFRHGMRARTRRHRPLAPRAYPRGVAPDPAMSSARVRESENPFAGGVSTLDFGPNRLDQVQVIGANPPLRHPHDRVLRQS